MEKAQNTLKRRGYLEDLGVDGRKIYVVYGTKETGKEGVSWTY
jgi:hypothetical protein